MIVIIQCPILMPDLFRKNIKMCTYDNNFSLTNDIEVAMTKHFLHANTIG